MDFLPVFIVFCKRVFFKQKEFAALVYAKIKGTCEV